MILLDAEVPKGFVVLLNRHIKCFLTLHNIFCLKTVIHKDGVRKKCFRYAQTMSKKSFFKKLRDFSILFLLKYLEKQGFLLEETDSQMYIKGKNSKQLFTNGNKSWKQTLRSLKTLLKRTSRKLQKLPVSRQIVWRATAGKKPRSRWRLSREKRLLPNWSLWLLSIPPRRGRGG